jgi:uncharacterized protein
MSSTNGNATGQPTPVSQSERIVILDALRGIAILGILLMNIPGFGLPLNQASDPSILKETGWNYRTWYYVDWIFAGTQRAFFSMLFGAGIILFINRLQRKVDGLLVAEYYFRRQLWLLVFGLFNAFVLLWFWDILFGYAICGMILFAFHRLSAKKLLIAAGICLLLMTARENRDLYHNKSTIAKGLLIAKLDTTTTKLNEEQKDQLGAMEDLKERSSHESKVKKSNKELRAIRADYATFYDYQSEKSVHAELYYTFFLLWDLLSFMFLGMALYKNGVLLGEGPTKLYWAMFIVGVGAGLLLSYLDQRPFIDNQFNRFNSVQNTWFSFYDISRTFRTAGFFGFIMLLYKSGKFKWIFSFFRPVGQMAFTNYLMQSFLCGLFFYGIGFGMFGKLERHQLYYVVGSVWLLEIIWSHIWLRYFYFGPLEWVWRSLTYWKKQPMKKA